MNENFSFDYDSEPIGNDELQELLATEIQELQSFKENDISISSHELTGLNFLGNIKYPFNCYKVSGQEDACKLTAPSDLPSEIKGIYFIDHGLQNLYCIEAALNMGVQACIYSHFGKSGTVTVSGMSALRFNTTRPNSPNSPHNKGKAFDVKLQGRMRSNGANYDRAACAYLCLYCVESGATRVYFSDQGVVDTVNQITEKTVCQFLDGHENHIHMHDYS